MMMNLTKERPIQPFNQALRSRKPLRILVVAEAVALAHMARATVLSRWAQEAGHEVMLAAGSQYINVAREHGIAPVHIDTIEPGLFASRLARGTFFYTSGELATYVRQERALVKSFQPDVIVSEFRLTMAISARLESRPLLSLANAYWSPVGSTPLPPPSKGPLSLLPYNLRAWLFKRIQPLALKAFCAPLNRLRRRHGLVTFANFREHYTTGEGCGYCDVPGMLPLSHLPKRHFYLGPIPWQPLKQPPSALAKLGKKHPIIYITLGSTGNAGLTRALIPHLLRRGYDLVVSGLETKNENRLKAGPSKSARLLMAKYFDPRPVLRKAVLTICHGGSGTIYQSLAHGVPLLCLPHNPDQGMAATAVEHKECGRTLPANRQSLDNIVKAVESLLYNSTFAIQASHMQQQLKTHDTKSIFLTKIKELASEKVQTRTHHKTRTTT